MKAIKINYIDYRLLIVFISIVFCSSCEADLQGESLCLPPPDGEIKADHINISLDYEFYGDEGTYQLQVQNQIFNLERETGSFKWIYIEEDFTEAILLVVGGDFEGTYDVSLSQDIEFQLGERYVISFQNNQMLINPFVDCVDVITYN